MHFLNNIKTDYIKIIKVWYYYMLILNIFKRVLCHCVRMQLFYYYNFNIVYLVSNCKFVMVADHMLSICNINQITVYQLSKLQVSLQKEFIFYIWLLTMYHYNANNKLKSGLLIIKTASL